MKKLLLTTLVALAAQGTSLSAHDMSQISVTSLENYADMDQAGLRAKRRSKDLMTRLLGRTITGTTTTLSATNVVREGNISLTVLSAPENTHLYIIRIDSVIPGLNPYSSTFTVARVGDDYVGNGDGTFGSPEQIFIKKVGRNLELSFSVLFDDTLIPPTNGQVYAEFDLDQLHHHHHHHSS